MHRYINCKNRKKNLILGTVPLYCMIAIMSLGGCGSSEESFLLDFDRSALQEMGVASLIVHAFHPEDLEGFSVDCDVLLDESLDTQGLVPLGTPVVFDLDKGNESVVVSISGLPQGKVWFRVLGYSEKAAGGDFLMKGCGMALIERGKKTTTVISMEPAF